MWEKFTNRLDEGKMTIERENVEKGGGSHEATPQHTDLTVAQPT